MDDFKERELERVALVASGLRDGGSAEWSQRLDMMRYTGHRSITTVSCYVHDAQIFRDAPASKLGL